jgi:hypothetical protein
VGHSFTKDDEAIVGAFLRYFDQIKKIRPDFSWEHAESAEPRELSEKVLALVKDKNVFIGICTRKEKTVSPHLLTQTVLSPDH